MGIIAGLLNLRGLGDSLKPSLTRMFEVQKHRDSAEPVILFGHNFGFGMANSQDHKTLNRGYFKKNELIRFVNDFIYGKGDYYYPSSSGIVALLTLELWQRKFIDKNV